MLKKMNYENWSKEELMRELDRIKNTTFGLVWHRDKQVEEKLDILINPDAKTPDETFSNELAGKPFPVLKEERKNEIVNSKSGSFNYIIEGDNYHALAVLNFTHQEGIDLIYIDPPYNTGNRSWRYNNDYVEKDDPFKHSKWLSFMEKRLRLARNLLKPDGVIVITIDDYELFPLGMLADEIFGEQNRIATITVLNKKSGRTTDKFFATCHEYYLVYARDINLASICMFDLDDKASEGYKYSDAVSAYKWRDFLRTGGFSTPEERPNSFYPIYFDESKNYVSIEKEPNCVEIFPIDSKGQKRVWRQTRPSLLNLIACGDIKVEKNNSGKYVVRIKDRIKEGLKPKTVWDDPRYDAATHGTKLLESILGKSKMFDFPKSLYAVEDIIKVITSSKKNSIILDFFAGSGTTGHAVLDLNRADGGDRKFILCTNNENNICTDVCYPRIKNVIEGYKTNNGRYVDGFKENLRYFTAYDFVEAKETDANKRKLVNKSTEMLCVKENAFELFAKDEDFEVYKNEHYYLGVIFNEDSIPAFKKAIKEVRSHIRTYVFSLGDDTHEKEFSDVKDKVSLCAIPEVILKVYREIFK